MELISENGCSVKPSPQGKGRKKVLQPETHKRNVDKLARNAPKALPAFPTCGHNGRPGLPYYCTTLTMKQVIDFHAYLYESKDKIKQDLMILVCCKGQKPKRGKSNHAAVSIKYHVRLSEDPQTFEDVNEPPSKIRILQDIIVVAPSTYASEMPSLPSTPRKVPVPALSSDSSQTDSNLSSNSPRKHQLRKVVKQLRNENNRLKKRNEKLEQELDTVKNNCIENISIEQYMLLTHKFCPQQEIADFINIHISQQHKLPRGRRYSLEFKSKCLAMYFTGKKLYDSKLRNEFCLPSSKILLQEISKFELVAGFNPKIFEILKMKVDNFCNEDKLCMLGVDEMSIKSNLFYAVNSDNIIGLEDDGTGQKKFKPALTATVFMIRGIKNNWN
uniref:Uncharacterized protein LOC114344976 n=1 Tax=Diabrotica virgifera virgifera TaxID=50390 RepID=A0A6P7H6L3_DIAVI